MSNITQVCRESRPLTYRKLGNLLASLGRNDSTLDETECFKLVFLQLNSFWSREIAEFLLASPLVTHEIEDRKSLPFSPKVENVFGEDLRLTLDPIAVNCVSRRYIMSTSRRALWNVRHPVDKLLPLFQVAYQKLNNPSKTAVSRVLLNTLASISDFFSMKCEPGRKLSIPGSPLFSPANPTYGSIVPDYCIRRKRQNVACVVNIKPPSFFCETPEGSCLRRVGAPQFFSSTDSVKRYLCDGNMAEVMIELQMCMIAACSRFGILCDGYHLILVEFRKDWFYYQKDCLQVLPNGESRISLQHDQSLTIPIRFVVVNVHSTSPSFLECLTYFLYRAKTTDNITQRSPLYKYLQLALSPRHMSNTEFGEHPSTTEIIDSTTVPIFGSDATFQDGILYKSFVQGIEDKCVHRSFHSISFKIPARVLRDVLVDEIDDDKFVVIKIYQLKPFHDIRSPPPSKVNYEQQIRDCDNYYRREWEAVRCLNGIQNVNNIYLRHLKLKIQYFRADDKPVTGYAIISKFLESEPLPQTLEAYELTMRQLEIIHKAGGVCFDHGVKITFSTGEIYLHGSIDFRHLRFEHTRETEINHSLHFITSHFKEALQQN